MIQNTPLDLSIKSNSSSDGTHLNTEKIDPESFVSNSQCLRHQKLIPEAGNDLSNAFNLNPRGLATELAKRSSCNELLPHSSGNYHDESCRRHRTAFTRIQTNRLEKEFQRDNYLSRTKRLDLAKELNLYENTIKVWFQNRRMKEKRQRISMLAWQHPAAYIFPPLPTPYMAPVPKPNPGIFYTEYSQGSNSFYSSPLSFNPPVPSPFIKTSTNSQEFFPLMQNNLYPF